MSSPGFFIAAASTGSSSSSTSNDAAPGDSSCGDDVNATDGSINTLTRTILSMEWVAETFIEACKCTPLDDVTYLKQSLDVCIKAGLNHETSERLKQFITTKEATLIEEFVAIEVSTVLELCGLGSVVTAYKHWKEEDKRRKATAIRDKELRE
jgi:hypothetical protein